MNRFIAIILFCSLLGQCFLQLGVVGYFKVNQKYIAANLCENRDKPQLKCCGKCYLKKQLKKAGDLSDDQKQAPKTEKYELLVFVLPALPHVPESELLITPPTVKRPASQQMHNVAALKAIFHPPGFIC